MEKEFKKQNRSIDLTFSVKVWQGLWLQHWPVALTHCGADGVTWTCCSEVAVAIVWPPVITGIIVAAERSAQVTRCGTGFVGCVVSNSLNWRVTWRSFKHHKITVAFMCFAHPTYGRDSNNLRAYLVSRASGVEVTYYQSCASTHHNLHGLHRTAWYLHLCNSIYIVSIRMVTFFCKWSKLAKCNIHEKVLNESLVHRPIITGILLCEGKNCTFVGNISHNPGLLQNTSNDGIISQQNYEGFSIRQVL